MRHERHRSATDDSRAPETDGSRGSATDDPLAPSIDEPPVPAIDDSERSAVDECSFCGLPADDAVPRSIRTGVDVQSIGRFEALRGPVRDGVLNRAFTPAERRYCERSGRPNQHVAARWAAKEAFRKLLDDVDDLPLASVEVVRRPDGPHLSLDGPARAALADALGTAWLETAVSLTHDRDADAAVAQVVALGGGRR